MIKKILNVQQFLTAIFYLIAVVAIIQTVNFIGVFTNSLDFLNWWPLGKSQLFSLGGMPDSVLAANTSGLSIDILVPGLQEFLKTHWLTRTGLSLITIYVFLAVLATFRKMLATVSINQPFDFSNIRRVQFIIALVFTEIFFLDYWRTESMKPVKALVEQMGSPIVGTDSSYQNADAYAYILLLLLLTLLSIFRRGMVLYQEQRAMEERLFQKKKIEAVGALASGVGHDFNNILTSIIGYAELAKVAATQKDADFALDRVLEASNRAKRLTQQIRAIGGQSTQSQHDEVIDLKEEVDELLLSIEPMIPDRVKIIKAYSSEESFPVKADPTKIYQVLLNLCTNAIQAMEKEGGDLIIEIKDQRHDGHQGYFISFKDEGSGISEEEQKQIFEPYFTTRHQVGGTGLGLALCQSIIESYQGHISVKSEKNQGSEFIVWLRKESTNSLKQIK